MEGENWNVSPRVRLIPQQIRPGDDPSCLARDWGLSLELAVKLVRLAELFTPELRRGGLPPRRTALGPGYGIEIISGMRTESEQNALRASGRPTAANDKSTHLSCPATGADLWMLSPSMGNRRAEMFNRVTFGANVERVGLRWGGDSRREKIPGELFGFPFGTIEIPTDWNHVDLGPRRADGA